MAEFSLSEQNLKKHLDSLAKSDGALKTALEEVGYPAERKKDKGFPVFVSIIVSQQLSTKAAATIKGRLLEKAGNKFTPDSILQLSDDEMRSCGLSHQKIRYSRNLCEKVNEGSFNPDHLDRMSDEEAIASITDLLGFGRWSAEMYLLFSLGRTDIWPVGDLAVQEAVKRVKKLKTRPKPKEMDGLGEAWKPYRSAAAIFLWHYYSTTPAI